jgi:hypothetical protein
MCSCGVVEIVEVLSFEDSLLRPFFCKNYQLKTQHMRTKNGRKKIGHYFTAILLGGIKKKSEFCHWPPLFTDTHRKKGQIK